MRSVIERTGALALVGALGVGTACGHDMTWSGDGPVVTSVQPSGGAVDVDPSGVVEIVFSRPMQMGAEAYAALHEGAVTGPELAGAWSWSDERTRLRFTPEEPLASGTQYTTHLGGGMMGADGDGLQYESCLTLHGGAWATEGMMAGGMMGGRDMMGSGWRGADRTYGMLYTFTTR